MQQTIFRRAAAAVLSAVLLTGGGAALFGKPAAAAAPPEGAPTVEDMEVRTYRGIPYAGQFLGSDGEGDDITFAVVEQPKKGAVTVDGVNFTYTPKENAAGADRFTYAATDSGGRVSAPATVTVSIEKTRSGVTYSDVDPSCAAAAQYLAEEGIFTGTRLGQRYCFTPDTPVSRSEFLVMALETAGVEATAVTVTPFCDDDAIPTWAKAYAAAGVAQGVVEGRSTERGAAFRGGDAVTFNEAATILNRLLDMGDVELEVWYADRAAVPSWAAQAVGNMEALSVLQSGSFGSPAMAETVTRADAARMLSAAGTLLAGQDSGGLLGWLK